MANNLKEIKTTILGALLLIVGLVYFALPYFSENDLWEVNNLYLAFLVVGGILLILAPDKIISFAFSWLNKKKSE